MKDLPYEPDNKGNNPLQSDLSSMHESFKKFKFHVSEIVDVASGEFKYFALMGKQKGKKPIRLGNNKGALGYQSRKDANDACKRLEEWASV